MTSRQRSFLAVIVMWLVLVAITYVLAQRTGIQVVQKAEAYPTIHIVDSGRLGDNQSYFLVKDVVQSRCVLVIQSAQVFGSNPAIGLTSQPWPCP